MLPAKHITSTGAKSTMPDAAPPLRPPAPRNMFESVCHKCFNVLRLSPSLTVCNYHGCRNRIPIQYVTKCPKGEF